MVVIHKIIIKGKSRKGSGYYDPNDIADDDAEGLNKRKGNNYYFCFHFLFNAVKLLFDFFTLYANGLSQ